MNCLTLNRHADGLAEIIFDKPGKSVNTLDLDVFTELAAILDDLGKQPPRGLLVRSGKPGQFIAGADVTKIGSLLGHADAGKMAAVGRDGFTRFSRLPFPTAALITGATLGGGLEWALACDWILCADDSFIRIGLPEVQLGILPAWGGTSRLPRRVGLTTALEMILQGKKLDPKRARKAGLADAVAPVNQLPAVAEKFLAKGKRRAEPPGGFKNWLLTGNPLGLFMVYSQTEKTIAKTTRGHYPAPSLILTAIKQGWGAPIETALKAEAAAVEPLLNSPVAKSLVGIFLMSEAAKKKPYADEGVKPAVPGEAMVIGAGVMGSGIAVSLLQSGAKVWLKEVAAEPLMKGVREVEKWLGKDAARKRTPPAEARAVRQRLAPVLADDALRDCDLVIEAVVEKLEVKRAVFAACEAKLPADALLATNTSSLPVSELQKGAQHPGRIAGLHFFNPAPLMPLVEIIRGEKTSRESLARLHALVVKLGKTPVVVKDGPGFLVNRLLAFYLNESAAWLAEGVPVPVLDSALKNFGMPMGPAELMDVIGLDVAVHAGGVMEAAWPDRARVPALLKQLVQGGRLGKKVGKGFYTWAGEKKADPLPVPSSASGAPAAPIHPSAVDLVDRCILPMVNEAATCLQEGVVDSPAALDLAMIFGTGFAPFRGGLLRHADAFTADHAISRLETLAKSHGPHLAPGAALKAMAGKKFYEL